MSKKLINLSNLQKFLLKLNERFALKKAMKGITEDSEGNIIIGEEGLVPTPDENSKGKFLRSDGTWSVPGDSLLYETMSQEEGIEGVSEVDRVINAKTLKAVIEENENVVHTSGNEDVSGVKTFTDNMYIKRDGPRFRLQDTRGTKGTKPESSIYNQALYICDANQIAYGGLHHSYLDDSRNQISMISFSGTTNDNEDYAKITVGYDGNGKWFTYAPTPAETDNSTKIATTEFVSKKDGNVVHKSGSETIAGTKTFSNQMYLGSGGTGYGLISAKDNNSILRLFGGASAGTGANLDLYGEGLNDGSFSLRARTSDKIVGLDGKIDGTLKWNGKNVALDENLVHRSGDETIAGNKTFSNRVSFPSGYYITTDNDNSLRIIRSGSDHGIVHKIIIQGDNGRIYAPNGFKGYLEGNADTATSANDPNAVHKTGNETINGIKMFTDTIHKKNSALDLQVNPSSDQFNSFLFTDKNNAVMVYLGHKQTTTGVNAMGLYAKDKSNKTHGFQVTSEDNVIPLGNGVVNLGLSGAKWKNVYATTFNGNLKGNADTATSAGNGVDSCGEGWIRFKNGIQMCWGSGNNSNTSTSIVVNFARAFSSPPVIFSQCFNSALYNCWIATKNSNHFTLNFDKASTVAYDWIAIGTWK